MDIKFPYKPICKKTEDFHYSTARRKALTGGWGCGKTTAMMAEGILLGTEYPNNLIVICRNTFGELDRSTRLVFEEICPTELIKKPYSISDHTIHFINGTKILFFPLDDVSKLKSLNAGAILLDEASEVGEEIAINLWSRRGRRAGVPAKSQVFLVASNPTLTNHWLYRWFQGNADPDFFHEKLTTYDNEHNLPEGYIEDLKKSLPEDMFQRYVMGEWGHVTFGERVYPEFGIGLHTGSVEYDPSFRVIRGWDFGYIHPAVAFLQIDDKGRIKGLSELLGKNTIIERFAEDVIHLGEKEFPNAKFEDYGDPSGDHRSKTGVTDTTAIRVLRETYDIHVKSRPCRIRDRLDLVRRKLGQIIEGSPSIVLDDKKCSLLIEGMAGGYACKKAPNGEILKDVPNEDGYYEHLQDAWGYAMANKFSTDMKKFSDRKRGLPVYSPAFPGTSW